MLVKDLNSFHKKLDQIDLEIPPVVIISGSDTKVLEAVIEKIKGRLHKEIGQFETTLFTGESGEDTRLQSELFNVPLFSPYRILIIKQGPVIFKPIIASKQKTEILKENFKHLPDRTLLLIQYDGQVPAKLTSIFNKHYLQLETKDLYPNQIQDAIRDICHKLGIKLDGEAIHFLSENTEPKSAFIEQKLSTLKEFLGSNKDQLIKVEQIREVLFPGQGCNSFAMVDALFANDRRAVKRELVRFNPDSDNYLGILKLILNRTNEIRKFQIGLNSALNDDELIKLLGFQKRHSFVQKKILSRLKKEAGHIPPDKISSIYNFLINIETEFKSGVKVSQQHTIFEQKIFQLFFI